MAKILGFFLVIATLPAFAGSDKEVQAAMVDSAKVICGAIHQRFLKQHKEAVIPLTGHNGEILDSCIAQRLKIQKVCNDAFMAKATEMGRGKAPDAALKEKMRKELVPEQKECLLENDKKLITKVEKLETLFQEKKLVEAQKFMEELK